MGLLELPLELFERTLDLVITNSRLRDIVRLRLVNRLFDRAILQAWGRTKSFASPYESDQRPGWTELVAKYLAFRPHTKGRNWNANFSTLINQVVDRILCNEVEREPVVASVGLQDNRLRDDYLKSLCRRLYSHDSIVTEGPVTKLDFRYHIFPALIHLRKLHVVQLMLSNGDLRDLSVPSEFWDTPLVAAVEIGEHDLVRQLLDRGADINQRSKHSRGTLYAAISKHSDRDMMNLLLHPAYALITSGKAFEDDIVSALDIGLPWTGPLVLEHLMPDLSSCHTILTWGIRHVCRRGMMDIARLLLNNGADVHGHQMGGPGPIEQASWKGEKEMVRFLLSRGADPGGAGPFKGPMTAAIWGDHITISRILLEAGINLPPAGWNNILRVAVPRVGSGEIVKMIFDKGVVDIFKLNKDPVRAHTSLVNLIMMACRHGNINAIEVFVSYGIPLNDDAFYKTSGRDNPPPIVYATAYK